MFRPLRILVIGGLALIIYTAFYAPPGGKSDPSAFDPDTAASYETELWKAAKTHSDVGIFMNAMLLYRNAGHLTWYRAAQAGYSYAQALGAFVGMTDKFEHILPDLQDAAEAEKAGRDATYTAATVARDQLTWMITARDPNLTDTEQVAALMAEEYGARFGTRPDLMYAAAAPRADAFRAWIMSGPDVDYPSINKQLTESYRALQPALQRVQAARASVP